MKETFNKHIESNLNFLKEAKLLIAISGGIDSVVLTNLCKQLGLNIALAHCNFNLRGDESDSDEAFVLDLAEQLDLEVFIENFDTKAYAEAHQLSIQMAARELRYDWFSELAEQLQFDYILTAHHADDNLETFLINFTRGTGLDGLTGIPEINGKFVRPLLPFSRTEVQDYAKDNKLGWREDSSNSSVKYLRNKLRHEVIPILKEINPSLLQSFKNTTYNLNASADLVEDCISDFLQKAIQKVEDHQTQFKISEFKALKNPKAYLFEIFKEYEFKAWDDILDLLDAQPGKYVASETHRLIKDREHLILTNHPTEFYEDILVSLDSSLVKAPFGTLVFEDVKEVTDAGKHIIYVDKSLLKHALVLRKHQDGDAFYPFGMNGKKKLSKYFKDEKFSLVEKENTWLLCSGDDIVWVINHRADNRFRVTEKTEQILKIELVKA